MTTPTNEPRAADVPEAVREAIGHYRTSLCVHNLSDIGLRQSVNASHDALLTAIVTALREARADGAQEAKQERRSIWRFALRCAAHLTLEQIEQAAEGTGVSTTFCVNPEG